MRTVLPPAPQICSLQGRVELRDGPSRRDGNRSSAGGDASPPIERDSLTTRQVVTFCPIPWRACRRSVLLWQSVVDRALNPRGLKYLCLRSIESAAAAFQTETLNDHDFLCSKRLKAWQELRRQEGFV